MRATAKAYAATNSPPEERAELPCVASNVGEKYPSGVSRQPSQDVEIFKNLKMYDWLGCSIVKHYKYICLLSNCVSIEYYNVIIKNVNPPLRQ